MNEINNSKKLIEKYKITIYKYETINNMNNNKITELEKENNNLKQIINDNNESNKKQLSEILEENNNLKKILDEMKIYNKKYKNENSKLIEKNNILDLKIQKLLLNTQKTLSYNKSQEYIKNYYLNDMNETNFDEKWKNSNNYINDKLYDNKENYFENSNNFDSISLMNKKIDNLNKKNQEIFKIIGKNSKSFYKEKKHIFEDLFI